MMTSEMPVAIPSDVELVTECLKGDQDAFRQVVERYQTLVCSLAYCATGNLTQSEDLAQETFVMAWEGLPELREPAKLRSWLCGIVRFRIGKLLRKQGREPSHAAESMEAIARSPSPDALPPDHAISNEEKAILWRSLEHIPEIYREPLVLFYREQQSVEAVARNLELSEDAVKQRLSRGRKLLHEQVLAFVEGALARTNPGQAFTLGVLAALPATFATSAKAGTLATAVAKGGAMAKGATLLSVFSVLLGPVLGAVGAWLGLRANLKNTRTPRERTAMLRYSRVIFVVSVAFVLATTLFVPLTAPLWNRSPVWTVLLGLAIVLAFVIYILISALRFNGIFARLREEERQLHPEAFPVEPRPQVWEYRSRATFLGLPLVHWRNGRLPGQKLRPAIGWIACGEVAYGILFANGGLAVGGISMGGASIGLISFGGLSIGLLAFGGFALGGAAMGGAAIGVMASGGLALGWHAAFGGFAAAYDFALGGGAFAAHANDAVAREFFAGHRWLDIGNGTMRNLFWIVCFAPVIWQTLLWTWMRRRQAHHAAH